MLVDHMTLLEVMTRLVMCVLTACPKAKRSIQSTAIGGFTMRIFTLKTVVTQFTRAKFGQKSLSKSLELSTTRGSDSAARKQSCVTAASVEEE